MSNLPALRSAVHAAALAHANADIAARITERNFREVNGPNEDQNLRSLRRTAWSDALTEKHVKEFILDSAINHFIAAGGSLGTI